MILNFVLFTFEKRLSIWHQKLRKHQIENSFCNMATATAAKEVSTPMEEKSSPETEVSAISFILKRSNYKKIITCLIKNVNLVTNPI